ncbi:hypothetical protein ACFVW8_10445 [Streptomyces sp. NPDC058221]|uniref:hypothetical protein n=1 Tax=Streptomyces sp. NPDC058221 TaxID=3346388 RepID=UPI0036EC536F
MAVSGPARVAVWVLAVVAGVVSAGLIVALVVNPDMADRTASVIGAIVGLAAVVLAVIALVRSPGTSGDGRRVRSGRGGIAAGGNITGSAIGDRSSVVGPPTARAPAPPAGGRDADVRAGRDGIAAAGDIADNALGDDSERR